VTANQQLQRTVIRATRARRKRVIALAAIALLCVSACLAADGPEIPLKSGAYQFQWKDAEFPNSDGFPVRVEITDRRMRIINERVHREVPLGELADGELMWHAKSSQWILGHAESDKLAPSVGGCDGADPFVVDFHTREIWTCQWGP
jgi:hypothetical protein